MNQQIEIEQRKLKVKETELVNLLSNYSLSKSLETVALLRYKNDDPTNENISCKQAAKDVPDVIMQDDFLDGHCASLINKKIGRKIKQSTKEDAKKSAQKEKKIYP